MKYRARLTLTICLLATAAGAGEEPKDTAAAKVAAPVEASIPFANHDGIYTWQVENDHSLLIQGQNRKWYKATLMSSCWDLPFAEKLAFETNPGGSLDKFSAVRVRNQRCPFVSLVETTAPVKKAKKLHDGPKLAPPAVTH